MASRDFICVDGIYVNLDRVSYISNRYEIPVEEDPEPRLVGLNVYLAGEESPLELPLLRRTEMSRLLNMSDHDFITVVPQGDEAEDAPSSESH